MTTEKHLQAFEHFSNLFEIDHDDVFMWAFALSLQGDAKVWFKHLHPKSINTWEELFFTFLKFWGRRRPLEQILSKFYSLRRHDDEAISSFNRRFASFYYNMPKEVQPLENTAKIYYVAAFPPNLSLLLLERKSTTLQHMFADCLEVEENLDMSKKLLD